MRPTSATLVVAGLAAAASLVAGPASAAAPDAPRTVASHHAAAVRTAPGAVDVAGLAAAGVVLVMLGGGALMVSGRGSLG
jgi:hypothetical protein